MLVTGAAGFAGGHLLERLAGHHELVGWSRSAPAPALAGLATWQHVDLLDRERVRALARALRPSAVYHLAGVTQVSDSFADTAKPLAGNVLATHHLFDALRRAGAPCRILLTSSATVYDSSDLPLTEESRLAPASPYGVSKLAQEQLGLRAIREDGLEVVVARRKDPWQRPAAWAEEAHVGARDRRQTAAIGGPGEPGRADAVAGA